MSLDATKPLVSVPPFFRGLASTIKLSICSGCHGPRTSVGVKETWHRPLMYDPRELYFCGEHCSQGSTLSV